MNIDINLNLNSNPNPPVSLDWNLTRDTDRLANVETLLANTSDLDSISPASLESYANFILWGEDENGATQTDKRLAERAHKGTIVSLEGLADTDDTSESSSNPSHADYVVATQERDTAILHPTYKWKRDPSNGATAPSPSTLNDSTPSNWWWDYESCAYKPIPEMAALWENIDRLVYEVAHPATLPPNSPITKSHQIFILKRTLREQRFTQCLLRDSYAPTLAPRPTWNSYHPDSIAADRIDLEDPKHIKYLLRYYCALREDTYEHLENSMHMLLLDLEDLIEETPLTDLEIQCACGLLAHNSLRDIADRWNWDHNTTEATESSMAIATNLMCRKLARTATQKRLLANAGSGLVPTQKCIACGRVLPQTTFFFYKNNHCKRGYNIRCKECYDARVAKQKQERARTGGTVACKKESDTL